MPVSCPVCLFSILVSWLHEVHIKRFEYWALTGSTLLPAGHEVPILPALPSVHRGRRLLTAEHKV